MLDFAFWKYLEERIMGGSLTTAHAEQCLYDVSIATELLIEFSNHDKIYIGDIIQQCLKAYLHHKAILHQNPKNAARPQKKVSS